MTFGLSDHISSYALTGIKKKRSIVFMTSYQAMEFSRNYTMLALNVYYKKKELAASDTHAGLLGAMRCTHVAVVYIGWLVSYI